MIRKNDKYLTDDQVDEAAENLDEESLTEIERTRLDTKRKFYSQLSKKPRKTKLDRLKEQYLDLSERERAALDDWTLDVALDEKDAQELEATTVGMMDFLPEVIDEMNEDISMMKGLPSGFWPVDNMALGFAPGEMTVVAGETSQGKTLFCLNVAARLALDGHRVLFVTLEMTHKEVSSRLFYILSLLTDYDMSKIEAAAKLISYQRQDKLNWKTIPTLARKAVEDGNEIMFIDHLHYFVRGMDNTAEGLGLVTQEFKRAALKHKIPVVVISHTRKVEKGKKQADINDLRGSSYIAQDADIVLMVSQNPDMKNKIFITLEKNRNRLKYAIGTSIGFDKRGLLIEDIPQTSDAIRALAFNDVNYDPSKHPITSLSGAVATPPVTENAPEVTSVDVKNPPENTSLFEIKG